MFKNYLTIAIRNLMRHKVYSFINITGLAIGMACCALILLYTQHELSYDTGFSKEDRIYQVWRETTDDNGNVQFGATTSGPLAATLKQDFPEVENAVRLNAGFPSAVMMYGDKSLPAGNFYDADPAFLRVFDFEMIAGDRESALQTPFSLVITEQLAQLYFGSEDPLGKHVTISHRVFSGDYAVTGVVRVPQNTTIQFDMLTSSETPTTDKWMQDHRVQWQTVNNVMPYQTFVVLKEGVPPQTLLNRLPDFIEKMMGKKVRDKKTYHLQPLSRRYLYTDQDYQTPRWMTVTGDITTIYLFGAIACLILGIASVNYMNLSTARSSSRAKEVGLRKVSGAFRLQLMRQFLGESILLSMLAFVLSVGLIELTLPHFNAFLGKDITPEKSLSYLLIIPFCITGIALLSGSYPALFLSAYEPVDVLKGYAKSGGRVLRKGLVVCQFAISILLIIGTITVYRQLNYVQNKSLGYNKDHLIMLPIFNRAKNLGDKGLLGSRYQTVKQAFLSHPNILSATAHRIPVTGQSSYSREVELETGEKLQLQVQEWDDTFLDTYEIPLISGRTFSKTPIKGSYEILLNETAAKLLGDDPIGQQLNINSRQPLTVVGIMKDFNFESLHKKIAPYIVMSRNTLFSTVTVRVKNENLPETMAFLEKTWKDFLPNMPFEYTFADDQLDQIYQSDQKVGQMVSLFASLAIVVACLGLFGLAAFTAEQRTKEIGVRKVLGASVGNIVLLLSKEFAWLVLIANVIAWPVAYFASENWLQGFAYRVDVVWWVFALSGLSALLIALGTVGYQAIRAALANPIDALRYE